MRQFTNDTLTALLQDRQPPCVSIYQPTLRAFPGAAENPIRFKNLLKRAEERLLTKYDRPAVKNLLERMQSLLEDDSFWQKQLDSLAVFAASDLFEVVQLQRPVPEMLVVAGSFHTKPLIRILQTSGRYHVLCLTRQDVRLLEGSRDSLDEVELINTPRTREEARGWQLNHPKAQTGSGGMAALQDETTGESAEQDFLIREQRWFRIVDECITRNHSHPTGLPLILCADEALQHPFRVASKNPQLMEEGITLFPNAVGLDRLRHECWRIIEPYYHAQTQRMIDKYQAAKARQNGSEDLRQVAEAATFGRVAALLVDGDKHIGGTLDPTTGKVEMRDLRNPDTDDLLDDTAERVLKTGGQVVVLPSQIMPSDTGVAAVYRY